MRYLMMALVVAATGCSQPSSKGNACTPGATQACTCTDGRSGAQSCGDDGTFGACSCTGGMPDAAPDTPAATTLGADWTSLGDVAFGTRKLFMYTVHNSEMWVVGGRTPSSGDPADAWHSTDGATWTASTGNGGFAAQYSGCLVSFKGALWMIDYDVIWSSPDGITWTQQGTTPNNYQAPSYGGTACVVFNNTWFLIGGYAPTVYSSTDGTTWTETSTNYGGAINGATVGAAVFNNEIFAIATNGVFSSADGATWVPQTLQFHGSGPAVVAGSKLYAFTGTGSSFALAATSDGANWSTVDAAMPWTSNTAQCSNLGFFYFGSSFYVVGGNGPCVAQAWKSP